MLLLISVFWFAPRDESLPEFTPRYDGDIVMMPRINEPKPPELVDIPLTIETKTSDDNEVKEPPMPLKPSVDLNNELLTIESNQEHDPKDRSLRQEYLSDDKILYGSTPDESPVIRNAKDIQKPNTHTESIKLDRELFTISTSSETTSVSPRAETGSIQLETENTLNDVSLNANAPKIHYGSRRGEVLKATGMGNTWGGSGSTSGGSKVGGIYIKMMQDIARQLTAATTKNKVDVVFVLDETASMVDNIRGIRAYFKFVFDAFERDGRDATYGLVTFTDKVKTYGRTDDLGAFKNWLFKIDVDRGGDISEAGLDALMAAITKIKFRRNAQRFFIFASDAAFHDADYDGRSIYSLDETIATLQKEQVRVEVIGLDYLPIKQLAMATGGTWRAIPGKGFLEYVPPITLTEKMLSKLGTLSSDESTLGDKITVYVNNPPRPKQLTLTWKVLNPLGERCYGPFTENRNIPDESTLIEMTPLLDKNAFQTIPGVYTVIYRLENDRGHKSILRRTLTHQ